MPTRIWLRSTRLGARIRGRSGLGARRQVYSLGRMTRRERQGWRRNPSVIGTVAVAVALVAALLAAPALASGGTSPPRVRAESPQPASHAPRHTFGRSTSTNW